MNSQRWKRELDFLKKDCSERDAVVLPPIVIEWFDLNRDFVRDTARLESLSNEDIESSELLKARIESFKTKIAAIEFDLGDWRVHADVHGWRLLMQPYTRDGVRHQLLCVRRNMKPSEKDLRYLDKFLAYLGADSKGDFLMHTRDDTDPDVQDFWTWSPHSSVTSVVNSSS
jgi:hypothetical protein